MLLPGKAGGTAAVRRTLASTICRIADPTLVARPRQLRDASAVMRFRPAHQSMINRRHDGRASRFARQSLQQMLERKPRIYLPATCKGGHESGQSCGPRERARLAARHLQWLPPTSGRPVIADRLRGDDGEPAELTPGRRGSIWAPGAGLFSFDRSRSPDRPGPPAVTLRRAPTADPGRNCECRDPRTVLSRDWRQCPKFGCSETPASFRSAHLLLGWDALSLAVRELCRLFPSVWTTEKADERWLAKDTPEAFRVLIRVWGVLNTYRPPGQTSWSKVLQCATGRTRGWHSRPCSAC
jgi:hypothetical protein